MNYLFAKFTQLDQFYSQYLYEYIILLYYIFRNIKNTKLYKYYENAQQKIIYIKIFMYHYKREHKSGKTDNRKETLDTEPQGCKNKTDIT